MLTIFSSSVVGTNEGAVPIGGCHGYTGLISGGWDHIGHCVIIIRAWDRDHTEEERTIWRSQNDGVMRDRLSGSSIVVIPADHNGP